MNEPCWYCGEPSDLLCDHIIGRKQVAPGCSSIDCQSPATLIVGAGPEFAVCDSCAASPAHRRKRTRVPFDPAATEPVTCDAAACRRCAQRFGWKQVMSGIVCTRSGRGRGCHDMSLHRCHAHAGEGAESAPTGTALQAACVVLFASAGIPDNREPAAIPAQRWRENTDLFLRELREGRRWQEWAAAELKFRGLRVELPPHEERRVIEDADRWTTSDADIYVYGSAVGDCVLEVKSRLFHFIDPLGYPYPTAIVDTVDGWHAKAVEPRAVLLVSRPAKRILAIASKTRPAWGRFQARDRVRNTVADFYECPRPLLRSFEWLVKRLQP